MGLVSCLALAAACGAGAKEQARPPAPKPQASPSVTSVRMPDERDWMAKNLALETKDSFCYEGKELNCRLYGRLYPWASAARACVALGNGWRLPTDGEWRELAARLGESREAYRDLVLGGETGFDAVHGGGRESDGRYARLPAHGFYWTSTATGEGRAVFFNFAREKSSLTRHTDGDVRMALSVRCVRGRR